jgi:Ran GTPase-activating protein (RanGAP) involved in mRNA processing and transport
MVLAVAAAAGVSMALVRCTGGRAWSAEAAEALCRACPGLRSFEFDVQASAVTPQLCRVLAAAGAAGPCRARALTFRGLLRSPRAAAELAAALRDARALRRCALRGRVHPAGLPLLLAAVAGNEGIEELSMGAMGIGPAEATLLATRLAAAPPHLKALSLRDEPLGDLGAAALASGWLATSAASALVTLEVTRCGLRAAGAEALATALGGAGAAAAELRTLRLSGNALRSTDALQALGELVSHAPRLAELDLSNNGINAADNTRPLWRALEAPPLPPLRRLVLRGNRVGTEGARLVSHGPLRNGTLLESLDLADAGIGSEGGEELAAAARMAPRLRVDALQSDLKRWQL